MNDKANSSKILSLRTGFVGETKSLPQMLLRACLPVGRHSEAIYSHII